MSHVAGCTRLANPTLPIGVRQVWQRSHLGLPDGDESESEQLGKAQMNTRQTTVSGKARKNGLSLRLKLTLLAVAISAVPMAIVGFLLIDVNEDALENSLREHFFTIIDSITAEVDTTVIMTQADLSVVALTLANAEVSESNRVELIRGQVAAQPTLSWVAIYDHGGVHIDTVSPPGEPAKAPASLSADLRAEAETAGRAVGAVTATADMPEALLVVPMRGKTDTWFVVTSFSLEAAQIAIERFIERRFYQDHYTIYVVDAQKRALAHSNREFATNLTDLGDLPALDIISSGALRNGTTVFHESLGSGDDEAVVALASMRTLPWSLGVEIPRSVAYQSFSQMRLSVVVVVMLIILLATAAAVFFAGRITKPISTLVGFANDLAARRFHRVECKHPRRDLNSR